jgi:asparagine synthase (glutamine-hydrolysing)
LPECDERAYTEVLAAHTGVEIHYLPAEQFWLLDDPVLFTPTLESPYLTWESVEHAILRHFQQLGAQLLLTGHSAERIILGTPLIYADRFWRGRLGVLWELARLANAPYHRVLFNYLLEPVLPIRFSHTARRRLGRDRAGRLPPWLAPDFVQRTRLIERLEPPPAGRPKGTLAQQAIYQQLFRHNPNRRIFYWYDRLAARYGMEARHPFLDRRLAEFILAIPPEQLFHQGYYKMIMRRAMTGILPDSIRWRLDKTQFHRYTNFCWEKAADRIQQLFTKPLLCSQFGFVDGDKLLERYAAYGPGRQNISPHELWPAVTMELWLKTHHPFIC